MFDFVHKHKKLLQVFLALIILPFMLWGVSSYDKAGNTADVAATVNGLKITRQELEDSLRQNAPANGGQLRSCDV